MKPTLVLNREDHDPAGPEFWRAVDSASQWANDRVRSFGDPWAQVWVSRTSGRDVVHAVSPINEKLFREVVEGRVTWLLYHVVLSCLMAGGGIGVDSLPIRPEDAEKKVRTWE